MIKLTKQTKPIKLSINDYLKMFNQYPRTWYKAPEGGYVIEIDDLPGCLSEGDSFKEAIVNCKSAYKAWIEVALEEDIEIPIPPNKTKEDNVDSWSTKEKLTMIESNSSTSSQALIFICSVIAGACLASIYIWFIK